MSLPNIVPRARSPYKGYFSSDKQNKEWIHLLNTSDRYTASINSLNQPFNVLCSSSRKLHKPLPKLRLINGQINRSTKQKIQRYAQIHYSPRNCSKSLFLDKVLKQRMMKPLRGVQADQIQVLKRKKRKVRKQIKSIDGNHIFDASWGN